MSKETPEPLSPLDAWAEATALSLELLEAGVRAERPGLDDDAVLELCRERIRLYREAKYGGPATEGKDPREGPR